VTTWPKNESGCELLGTGAPRLVQFGAVYFGEADTDLRSAIKNGNRVAVGDVDDTCIKSLGVRNAGQQKVQAPRRGRRGRFS